MPALKTYDLFISHCWKYGGDYGKIVSMLDGATNFKWRNYSCPVHDPAIDPDTEAGERKLKSGLDVQIRPVNCVLVIAGMYAAYRKWIQAEIEIAQKYGKPIVGIKPWGAERVPQAVQDAAVVVVNWNTDSIVKAIRDYSL